MSQGSLVHAQRDHTSRILHAMLWFGNSFASGAQMMAEISIRKTLTQFWKSQNLDGSAPLHQNSPKYQAAKLQWPPLFLVSKSRTSRRRHLEGHKLYHASCAIQSRWSHVFVQLEHLQSEHVPGWQPHVGHVHHYQQRLWPYLGERNIGPGIEIWFQAVGRVSESKMAFASCLRTHYLSHISKLELFIKMFWISSTNF